MAPHFGATPGPDGTRFALWSGAATAAWACLFDPATDTETARHPLAPDGAGTFTAHIPNAPPGTRYGFRIAGPFDPPGGHRCDPAKLLVDPYAIALDRPFRWHPDLARFGAGTAALVPRAVVTAPPPPVPHAPPRFQPGGLIYEVNVRAFTRRHPGVPERLRGTVAALAAPPVLDHLTRLGVDAVELMPLAAWIDERHLAPLGLTNAWGYNPAVFMAPDPRLCPGGIVELADTVAALHAAGIAVILDVVFNHTGESDAEGPTLSLRGLDNAAYFRHTEDGALDNVTGCGNTLDTAHPATRRLILDSLRHFVRAAGIDGFRFDLASVLMREGNAISADAALIREITADPLLADRVLIAEPWDIGPGGYRLGAFPPPFLEWNDRYRDAVRRFWRGDPHTLGPLATALAGSSDTFGPTRTRSVNFIAAHDGFTLADLTAYAHKHNHANGEDNRDGHSENLSWNNGIEGPTAEPAIAAARRRDARALLATLFASRGTIMLTAGDEFGRTQSGNNNAYAQDNEITWTDWGARDAELEALAARLAAFRRAHPALSDPALLTGTGAPPDVLWTGPDGHPPDWNARTLAMILREPAGTRLAVLINGTDAPVRFTLPEDERHTWDAPEQDIPARSVVFAAQTASSRSGE